MEPQVCGAVSWSTLFGPLRRMVIGSQSILGSVAEPPAALVESMEADIYPVQRPELAELIEGAIGEGSPFHDLFGYYAQGVGPETAVLPTGWQERLVRIQNPNTDLTVGYCLDPHDLAISKLAAGREKDWPFVAEMIRHGFVEVDKLIALTAITPLTNRVKLSAWLQAQRQV
jgi:hypothetical protein